MGVVAELLLAGAMLSTGSLNTVAKKVMYQTKGVNIDGEIEYYKKPWVCTFFMFCGESMCMLFFVLFAIYYRFCNKQSKESVESQTLSELSVPQEDNKIRFVTREEVSNDPTGGLGFKFPLYVTLFASCDLLSTSLTGIGLMYCNASIIQILRGFVIVFTMLFAWLFLKRKPKIFQTVGVLFALFGLCCVGASAVLAERGSTDENHTVYEQLLGIGLTLLSQVFSSIQFVLEEKLLKQNSHKISPIPPLFLVGSEGLAGAILSICVALPIANAIPGSDHGSYENFKNSFYMLFHNVQIPILQFLYFISISFFNWTSFIYSKVLSSTSRTLVDACRTIVVWIVMVIVFYATVHAYGEPITYWSILQVFGFVGMLLGTTTHNNIGGVGEKVTGCCTKKDEEKLIQQPDIVNDTPLIGSPESETNKLT